MYRKFGGSRGGNGENLESAGEVRVRESSVPNIPSGFLDDSCCILSKIM